MFDLGRLGDLVTGFMKGNAPDARPDAALMDILQNSGISLESLQGLDLQQIVDLLAQHGIDLGNFAPEQVQSLTGSLGINPETLGNLGGLIGGFLERR